MPRYLLMCLFIAIASSSHAQKSYFQQHVDYTIDVSLDDKSHILRGFETIQYKNNSSDTLKVIFMHLWPNAYKDDKQSFTEQNVENGNTKFYYSSEDDKGFIDSISFRVNNEKVNVSTYDDHDDIVVIDLNDPLLPGKSVEINTPFRVVIPYTFSRLGHVGQSYQITQWYPKPAVFDMNGWHPLPYLDQGEFYSEYGTYSVSITLPQNYVVAATGDLQEESEKKFIEDKLKHVDTSSVLKVIPSDSKTKTISFKQSNVHDFAWFADKYLQVEKTTQKLVSGKSVDCYSYFKPTNYKLYNKSSKIIAKTIQFLSEHVGEYPYSHASIVDGSLIAGEGMEYPNIAVLGAVSSASMLRTVIIHEVGHNWFYGLLGSNERDYPWMDEGMNTYYEKIITEKIEEEESYIPRSAALDNLNKKLNGIMLYQLAALQHNDQPCNSHATEFTNLNYGGIVYQKTASLLAYVNSYLGDQVFEKAMKTYFNEWHYKHPSPADFRTILERESGKNLSWFFDQGLNSTTQIDFKISKVDRQGNGASVYAKSRTSFKGPIPIHACIKDSVVQTKWIEYPYNVAAVFSDLPSATSSFKIDAYEELPEVKISNNQFIFSRPFHKFGLRIRLGSSLGLSTKNNVVVLPALEYNFYDKLMLGGILHNIGIPNKKFQFGLMPLYSTNTKSLVGGGFVSYSFYPKSIAHQVTLGLQGRTYHEDESHLNIPSSIFQRYYKWSPSVTIDFKKSSQRSPITNSLMVRYIGVGSQGFKYIFNSVDSNYSASLDSYQKNRFGNLVFAHKNDRTFNPYSYKINAIGNSNFLKLSIEGNIKIDYYIKGKAFYARIFAGKYFNGNSTNNILDSRNQYLNATYSANNDITYDKTFLARSEQKGWQTHQISMQEGGFKIQSLLLSNPIGLNNNWLTAVNLRTDIPFKLPIKFQLFIDAGTYANAAKLNSSGSKLIFDGGVECHLFSDLIGIYAPFIMSKDFKDYTKSTYPKNRLFNNISFSLNLDKLDLFHTQRIIKQLN